MFFAVLLALTIAIGCVLPATAFAESEAGTQAGEAITRGEFLNLLGNLYILTNIDTKDAVKDTADSTRQFDDIDNDADYYQIALYAKTNGVIHGVGGNKFYPDRLLTKQDMFVIAERALEDIGRVRPSEGGMALREFDDGDQISDYARIPILTLIESPFVDLSEEIENSKFEPNRTVTSMEANIFMSIIEGTLLEVIQKENDEKLGKSALISFEDKLLYTSVKRTLDDGKIIEAPVEYMYCLSLRAKDSDNPSFEQDFKKKYEVSLESAISNVIKDLDYTTIVDKSYIGSDFDKKLVDAVSNLLENETPEMVILTCFVVSADDSPVQGGMKTTVQTGENSVAPTTATIEGLWELDGAASALAQGYKEYYNLFDKDGSFITVTDYQAESIEINVALSGTYEISGNILRLTYDPDLPEGTYNKADIRTITEVWWTGQSEDRAKMTMCHGAQIISFKKSDSNIDLKQIKADYDKKQMEQAPPPTSPPPVN